MPLYYAFVETRKNVFLIIVHRFGLVIVKKYENKINIVVFLLLLSLLSILFTAPAPLVPFCVHGKIG
jgi:hypothetical protein